MVCLKYYLFQSGSVKRVWNSDRRIIAAKVLLLQLLEILFPRDYIFKIRLNSIKPKSITVYPKRGKGVHNKRVKTLVHAII